VEGLSAGEGRRRNCGAVDDMHADLICVLQDDLSIIAAEWRQSNIHGGVRTGEVGAFVRVHLPSCRNEGRGDPCADWRGGLLATAQSSSTASHGLLNMRATAGAGSANRCQRHASGQVHTLAVKLQQAGGRQSIGSARSTLPVVGDCVLGVKCRGELIVPCLARVRW
jgi:hypothetical protein